MIIDSCCNLGQCSRKASPFGSHAKRLGGKANVPRQVCGPLPALVRAVRHIKRLCRIGLVLVSARLAPSPQLFSGHLFRLGDLPVSKYTPKWPFIRILASEQFPNMALVREIWPPAGTYALRFSRWSAV